jgi:hypothetical protein
MCAIIHFDNFVLYHLISNGHVLPLISFKINLYNFSHIVELFRIV